MEGCIPFFESYLSAAAPSMGSAIVKIYEDGKDEQLRFTFSFIRDSAIDESDDSDESDSQFSRLHRTNRWCRDREVQSPVPRQQRRGRPLRQSRVDQQTLQDSVRIKMSGSPDGIIPGTHPDVGNAVVTRVKTCFNHFQYRIDAINDFLGRAAR